MNTPIWVCAKCGTVMGDEESTRRYNELKTQLIEAGKIIERLRAENLWRIEIRDKFIVDRGLWQAFTESLPQPTKKDGR